MQEGARCLNLASSAAVALYEALRQNHFGGPKRSDATKDNTRLHSAEVVKGT